MARGEKERGKVGRSRSGTSDLPFFDYRSGFGFRVSLPYGLRLKLLYAPDAPSPRCFAAPLSHEDSGERTAFDRVLFRDIEGGRKCHFGGFRPSFPVLLYFLYFTCRSLSSHINTPVPGSPAFTLRLAASSAVS